MKNTTVHKRTPSFKTYMLILLIAVELLMAFTALGYIHLPPISITFAYIPIIIAGCFLGVKQSTVLGVIFGLTSMYKASAHYVMDFDQVFSPFSSGTPVASLLLSIGTRTAFGVLIGLLFYYALKSHHVKVWIGIIAAIAPKLHAFLVYAAMQTLFPQLGYHANTSLFSLIGDCLASLLCIVLIEVLWYLFRCRKNIDDFRTYVSQSDQKLHQEHRLGSWYVFVAVSVFVAVISVLYFMQRLQYMLTTYGFHVSSDIQHDMLHLQIQFLAATFSLFFIMSIVLILIYKYMSYREYLGQLDSLTGVMGRKMFLHYCETLQKEHTKQDQKNGYFLFADLDHFKNINDTFGHPTGDTVLKKMAQEMERSFSGIGKVGRMGGDEFAAMIDHPLTVPELEKILDTFLENIADIYPEAGKLSSSIGVCQFTYPADLSGLYFATDHLLYEAKTKGRACYVIGSYAE